MSTKSIKIQVSDELWERFYRAFPAHGERSALVKRVIRALLAEEEALQASSTRIAKRIHTRFAAEREEEEGDQRP